MAKLCPLLRIKDFEAWADARPGWARLETPPAAQWERTRWDAVVTGERCVVVLFHRGAMDGRGRASVQGVVGDAEARRLTLELIDEYNANGGG